MVNVTLKDQRQETMAAFEREILRCPEIVECFLMSGEADYMIQVEVRRDDSYERIQRFLSRFCAALFPLALPGGGSVDIETSLREMPSRMLPQRTFSFGGNKHASSQWQGLKNFGPARPAPQPMAFVYIYRQSQRGLAEDLYRALSGRSFKSTFHGIEELIVTVTEAMTLLPGDVVLTGTPAGVGPLVPGDEVSVTIERIGDLLALDRTAFTKVA